MRISKINSFILPKAINNKEVKKHDNIQNDFNTQNSSNAIKNYALSQITFKGKKDSLFAELFPINDGFVKDPVVNQCRQQVIDKLASCREFSPDYQGHRLNLELGVANVKTQEIADAKIALLDKFTNDKKWQNSKFIQENIGHLFVFVEKSNFVEFVDKILAVPALAENKEMQKQIIDMPFSYSGRKDDVFSYKLAVLDKFLSDSKLKNNKKVREKVVKEIAKVHGPEQAQAKVQMMDKYLKSKEWNESKDDNLEALFIDLLGVKEPATEKSRNSVIDIVIKNPKLYDTEQKQGNVYNIIYLTTTSEKAIVAEKLLSTPDFLQENLDGMFPSFLLHVDSKEYAEGVISLFDKITSEPKLRDNESIQKNLNGILYLWYNDKKEVADSRLAVIEKYLSDKELQKTEGINTRLGSIIEEANQAWKADIANCFLSDSKLYKDKWIQNRMVDTYRTSVGRNQDQPTAFEVRTKLIQNQKKYNQENLEKLLSCLIK